jgi:hypothetical protein
MMARQTTAAEVTRRVAAAAWTIASGRRRHSGDSEGKKRCRKKSQEMKKVEVYY